MMVMMEMGSTTPPENYAKLQGMIQLGIEGVIAAKDMMIVLKMKVMIMMIWKQVSML
jgi:hypothetical protein